MSEQKNQTFQERQQNQQKDKNQEESAPQLITATPLNDAGNQSEKLEQGEQQNVENAKILTEEPLECEKCIEENSSKYEQYKTKGNSLFKQGEYSDALMEYQQALKYTNDKNMRATIFSNMAICFIKQQDFQMAKKYCTKVIQEDQNHKKGRINLARCFEEEKKIQQAYEEYIKAEKLFEDGTGSKQDCKFVKDKIAFLKPKVDQLNESRKKQVMDGLKNIGNSILGYFGMSLDNFKLEQGPNGGYNVSFKQ